MFYQIEEVRFIEPDFYQVFNSNREKFEQYNGRRNNCANTVRTFLSLLGYESTAVTAWADTIRNLGQVIRDPNSLQKGDILAMGHPGDTWHVGVYMGDGKVLHQSAMRGYTVGVYNDLNAFVNSRRGFYAIRPTESYMNLLKNQFYAFPELT